MPPLHRMAIFVPPVCDHKICQVVVGGSKEAEWLPRSFKGGTQEVQTSPWTPWSPWIFEHVQNSRTKVAEEVGCSKVTQRRQKGGTSIAVVAEWRHKHCRGCRMEAQWSPNGRQVIDAFCCKFSRQSGRCFCLPCRWSSYTETGFSGVRWPLSVLAIFCSFKGGTKVAILCKGGIRPTWGLLIARMLLKFQKQLIYHKSNLAGSFFINNGSCCLHNLIRA